MRRRGILSGFSIKLMMAALMLLDHMHQFLPDQPVWMHMLGRMVAPVFSFLVAEGLYHTSDRQRYAQRMLRFGIWMLFGSIVLQILVGGNAIGNSILISLAISTKLVDCIEQYQRDRTRTGYLIATALLLLVSILFEGMFVCPMMVCVFYFFRDRPVSLCALYAGVVTPAVSLLGWSAYQWMMVFALIPILLYNGKRGPDSRSAKYFFYLFYPLHIWALYLIRHLT